MRSASQSSQRWAAMLMGRSKSPCGGVSQAHDRVERPGDRLHVGERVGLLGQIDQAHAHGALAYATVRHAGEAVEGLVVPEPMAAHLAYGPEGA